MTQIPILGPKLAPLPVAGYKPQTQQRVDLVNTNKYLEETILRHMEGFPKELGEDYDKRWLAVARTNLELAFMAMNRAVFQPERVRLPGDPA